MSISQSSTETSTSNTSFGQTENKYHGLLTVSKTRTIKHVVFDFISFLNSSARSPAIIVFIINMWRSIQWFIPSLFPESQKLFHPNSAAWIVCSVLSFFYRIIPISVESGFFLPYSVVILCLYYIFLACIGVTIFFFHKNGKVPKWVINILNFIFDGVWMLFVPVSYNHIGSRIGRVVIQDGNVGDVETWVVTALLLASSGTFFYINYVFTSVSLTYRRISYGAFDHNLQSIIISNTCLVAFITGITPHLPMLGRHICYALMVATYTFGGVYSMLRAGFTQAFWDQLFSASATCGVITTVVVWCLDAFDKEFIMVILFIIIILFFALVGLFKILDTKFCVNIINKLDEWLENPEDLNENPPSSIMGYTIATRGYAYGHPLILNWEFMDLMLRNNPRDKRMWILFARFVSAFPDDTSKLLWIDEEIRKLKTHSKYVGHLRAQILFLTREREDSMTHSLKKKVNAIQKEIQASRNRLRHFWECVIQGNTDDMEIASMFARKTVEKTEADINHLIRSYPNNQYVARIFARFILHIKGDKLEYSEWRSNIDKLKNGQTIAPDAAQSNTLELFPMILNSTVQHQNIDIIGGMFGESTSIPSISSSSCHFVDNFEEENNLLETIKNSVTNMSLPSIKRSIIFIIVITLIICCLYFPIVSVAFSIASQDSFKKISIISDMSTLRASIAHVVVLALQELSSALDIKEAFQDAPQINLDNLTMNSMGNVTKKSDIMSIIIERSYILLDNIRYLNDISKQSKELEEAQKYMFGNVVDVIAYGEVGSEVIQSTYTLSSETIMISLGLDCADALMYRTKESAAQFVKSTKMANIMAYFNSVITAVVASSENLQKDVENNQLNTNKIIDYVSFSGYCVISIIFLACIIYICVNVNHDKAIAARAFLTIPKHVISKLVDSLKISTSNNEFEEDELEIIEQQRNKQEENFIAMLATTSSANNESVSPTTISAVSLFFLLVVTILLVYTSSETIKSSNEIVKLASPHANYLMFTYTAIVCSYVPMLEVVLEDCGYHIIGNNRSYLIRQADSFTSIAATMYVVSKFGCPEDDIKPIAHIDKEISDSSFQSGNLSKIKQHMYGELSPDDKYHIVTNEIQRMIEVSKTENLTYDSSVSEVWYILFYQLYDRYYAANSDNLLDIIKDAYNSSLYKSLFFAFIFMLISIIIASFAIYQLVVVKNTVAWMISTLMLCQPEVLLASRPICSILQGEFKESKSKSTIDKNDVFYDTVIDLFVDSVIIVNQDLKIISANPATKRIFNTEDDIIGKDLKDVICCIDNETNKESDATKEFFTALNEGLSGHSTLKINKQLQLKDSQGTISFLNISVTAFSKKGAVQSLADAKGKLKCLNIVSRDVSQTVRSENLLKEERQRTDTLLRHILPPAIVDSLQAGEKDISFAVSSASICFMDIVSFTPWCAANTAQVVCSTLNKLFKEFDLLLAQHKTMTKIKCIGDCYMGAGGIFDNPNDPKQHAWDLVHFGCCCIRAVRKVDEELGESIRIRVGVNTGGPIVVGVLGVSRPTFEILGPAINMAQQMEQKGVPMNVHISRSVYEMVYGSNFVIHERGEIETKRGTVMTYLVDPDENPD